MANQITNEHAPAQPALQLSNCGMSVLMNTLVLAGSDLAATLWEQACVTWLAEHDQAVFGLGVVGFDLAELAWTHADFEQQHAFVLRVIDGAFAKQRWDVLDYAPPFAQADVRTLRQLVVAFRPEYVQHDNDWEWWTEPTQYTKCPRHQVYMHAHGCVICNDA